MAQARPFQWLAQTVGRLRRDRRGNVGLLFALSLPVIAMLVLGGVDISRLATAKAQLQNALDAATLAAARTHFNDDTRLTEIGLAHLNANLAEGSMVVPGSVKASFTINTKTQVITGRATADVKTLVANIVLPPYGQVLDDTLPISSEADADRSSRDLEVALVLDITGSMTWDKIKALKDAAKELVDIVVQDVQEPYYSKVSVVPYSIGVNLGSHANAARGTPVAKTTVSDVRWHTGSVLSLSNISRAATAEFTSTSAHGLNTGDRVIVWNVKGLQPHTNYFYDMNNQAYEVASTPSSTRFTLKGVQTTYSNALSNSSNDRPRFAKCARTDCRITVTSNNHGLQTTDGTAVLEGVEGFSNLNGRGLLVSNVTRHTFVADYVSGGTYVRGGTASCGEYGCAWRVFRNARDNSIRALANSTCVSERTGSHAYTDASPATARVSFNYPADPSTWRNPCPANVIRPLSSDRAAIRSAIDDLVVGGSTSGQIGAAWGWYTVSPNFNGLWPSSGAGEYGTPNLMKVVILMTDGEFNAPHASGVIASDAGYLSGEASDHINQKATNGDPFTQTLALCRGMKARGVTVYTVGFQVAANGQAANLMKECASSEGHAYLPSSNGSLSEAFKAIGREITRLRLSR